MIQRLPIALAIALVASAGSGCGRTHANVSGTVIENGQPYKHTGEMVQILMTCDAPSQSISATVQPNGSFKFYGPESKGLPIGKYKIGIESDTESAPGVKKRISGVNPKSSTMEIDLAGGDSVTLTIDLVKQTVKR